MSRFLRLRLAIAVGGVAVVVATATLALAALGGAAPESAGATLSAAGSVNDDGKVYNFNLFANESGPEPGQGTVGFSLNGPALGICTLTGGQTTPGTTPTYSCGAASFQAVSIEGCKAQIQAHGFSHSDFPFDPIYLGTMTYELEFEKTGPTSGKLKVVVYTPKSKNEVDGEVSTASGGGPISMSTCP